MRRGPSHIFVDFFEAEEMVEVVEIVEEWGTYGGHRVDPKVFVAYLHDVDHFPTFQIFSFREVTSLIALGG